MRNALPRGLLLLFVLFARPGEARGQSILRTLWSDLETVPGDLWHVYSSPARIGSDDLPALAAFTGGTLLIAANDAAIQGWIRDHSGTAVIEVLEPFRSEHQALSELGRNHKIMRATAAGYALGLLTGWDWLREASFGCALSNTANALVRSGTYRLIARKRPEGETDPYQFGVPGGDWEDHSFFGGHGANAFSCASFVAHRFDLGYAEPIVWALASGVALARLPDEAHWASDAVVGIGFGWLVGRMVAERYLERDRAMDGEAALQPQADRAVERIDESFHLAPTSSPGGPAVLFTLRLSF